MRASHAPRTSSTRSCSTERARRAGRQRPALMDPRRLRAPFFLRRWPRANVPAIALHVRPGHGPQRLRRAHGGADIHGATAVTEHRIASSRDGVPFVRAPRGGKAPAYSHSFRGALRWAQCPQGPAPPRVHPAHGTLPTAGPITNAPPHAPALSIAAGRSAGRLWLAGGALACTGPCAAGHWRALQRLRPVLPGAALSPGHGGVAASQRCVRGAALGCGAAALPLWHGGRPGQRHRMAQCLGDPRPSGSRLALDRRGCRVRCGAADSGGIAPAGCPLTRGGGGEWLRAGPGRIGATSLWTRQPRWRPKQCTGGSLAARWNGGSVAVCAWPPRGGCVRSAGRLSVL